MKFAKTLSLLFIALAPALANASSVCETAAVQAACEQFHLNTNPKGNNTSIDKNEQQPAHDGLYKIMYTVRLDGQMCFTNVTVPMKEAANGKSCSVKAKGKAVVTDQNCSESGD
jgi:hypothetical protein